MKKFAESFPREADSSGEAKPAKKKDAVILPFKPKEKEQTEGGNGISYEGYQALGGILSPEQYQAVLERATNGALSNSRWAEYARSMARRADIALSPKTEALYGILREEQKEDYSGRSDQELLSEALRFDGDMSSLAAFMEKYPNIFHSRKPPIF